MASEKDSLAAKRRRAVELLVDEEVDRQDEAVALFREIAAAVGDDAEAWDDLGWALNEVGSPEAVGCFDRALAIQPGRANAWVGRGMAMRDDPDEALRCFDRALAVEPDAASAWFLRSCVLDDLGRGADAEASRRRAQELDPATFGPKR